MVATLAHEFQHMIGFYQRDIVLDVATPTWLNELMSMVSEDLVGKKLYDEFGTIDLEGPRGVAPSFDGESGTAGPTNNPGGRLPYFNASPTISLSYWPSSSASFDEALAHYAISYAFGAYVARNYSGADLLSAMMDVESSTGATIVERAVNSMPNTTGVAFAQLLREWGAAVLLSGDESLDTPLRFNAGSWIDDATTHPGYLLGSINHFNYLRADSSGMVGPVVYDAGSYASVSAMEDTSLLFYRLADNASGDVQAIIRLPEDVSFAVVVK
jgi:hypothetical protein